MSWAQNQKQAWWGEDESLVRWGHLETVNWLIRNVVGYLVFGLIVLFQADIRRALAHFGRTPFGAYFARTQRADEILNAKGILVVPDILANAGGVTVSYFEWVQDRAGFFWRESEVNERLEDIMVQSFQDVAIMADKYGVSHRIAAYMLGISRVAHDTMVRGLYA